MPDGFGMAPARRSFYIFCVPCSSFLDVMFQTETQPCVWLRLGAKHKDTHHWEPKMAQNIPRAISCLKHHHDMYDPYQSIRILHLCLILHICVAS